MIKTGPWYLKDIENIPKNSLKVFSCFHCGGGSTMGYKLAGYDVLGGVEIDKNMMEVYRANHKPKYSYLMGIQEFNEIDNKELPSELFNLDILDGSPPCSSFSMSGSREKTWGKEKKFREGQAKQVLDDLFFHFINTADKLKPKVVIAENVEGLIRGKARWYVKNIFKGFERIGYKTRLFLLNSAYMGVPQIRRRTFFISHREDLKFPELYFNFTEKPIILRDAFKDIDYSNIEFKEIPDITLTKKYWELCKEGYSFNTVHEKGSWFNKRKLSPFKPCNTLTAKCSDLFHWKCCRYLIDEEIIRIQTFPLDFNFKPSKPEYVCGMSVPPFMMQRIALSIYNQWFKKE